MGKNNGKHGARTEFQQYKSTMDKLEYRLEKAAEERKRSKNAIRTGEKNILNIDQLQ